MIEMATIEQWITGAGFRASRENDHTLRLGPRGDQADDLPPFFAQLGENWLLLSILPVFAPDAFQPSDLLLRLLTVNRDMRIAKFALDEDGAVVLCAELPTESLDRSEVVDAVDRMVKYIRHYRQYLVTP